MRVLKISHSGLIATWRERERCLARDGVDITMATAAIWDEGGRTVSFQPGNDEFVSPLRTWGTHPNAFVFDPRPLWHLLGERWDVIDIHEEPCSLATAEVLTVRLIRRISAPVVLYSAQNLAKRYPPPFRWIERWALRTAAGVSVCNRAAGRILRMKGMGGQIAEIPLGVDTSVFTPGCRTWPESGRLQIGYVGRVAYHKGVDVLIDAVAACPEVELTVVGSGPDITSLEKHAAQAGIGNRVTFAGSVDQNELPARYRSFDIIAIPSISTATWEEQFCRVAAEAMACGVPVIASRSGSLPEVIGDAGLLVEPNDPEALRAAIQRLAADPALWSGLRTAGLARSEDFSWESIATSYRRLYEEVAATRVASRHRPDAARRSQPTGRAVEDQPSAALEVIVVAYGEPELLDTSLAALDGTFPVWVVDNSSSDAVRSIAERRGVRYLDPGRNLGFAAGVNAALANRRPDADVLLLNPDAVIGAAEVFELQRRLNLDPALACVAPAQISPLDGSIQRVGWPLPTPGRAWLEALGLGRFRNDTEFAIGSILLLRSAAIDDIGLFDERFFLYAEETDWQIRARRHGWEVALCPDILGTHLGAGTGGDPTQREILFHASIERLVRKHYGTAGWNLFRAGCLSGAVLRSVILAGDRRRDARRRLTLYWEGPCRRQEQKAARASA